MSQTPVNPYLRDAVLTATPEQLQLMLYDGAIRFAAQGRDAVIARQLDVSHEKLTRAQHIMVEMINGLNFDVNRELCARMDAIYNFIYRKLIDANLTRDVQHIDDALRVLRIERETWQLLVEKVSRIREAGDQSMSDSQEAPSATASGFSGPMSDAEVTLSVEG